MSVVRPTLALGGDEMGKRAVVGLAIMASACLLAGALVPLGGALFIGLGILLAVGAVFGSWLPLVRRR